MALAKSQFKEVRRREGRREEGDGGRGGGRKGMGVGREGRGEEEGEEGGKGVDLNWKNSYGG